MRTLSDLLISTSMVFLLFVPLSTVKAEISTTQFEEIANPAGITYVGASWGSMWGDFNADGAPDLWLVNHFYEPSLYLNQGDETFLDIASQVIEPDFLLGDTHGATWVDFDNDGDMDLYQLADGGSDADTALFFNNNNGQMEEQGSELGLDYALGRGRMPVWLDFNRDGLLDVFYSTHRRSGTNDWPNGLLQQGPDGFTNVADQMGLIPNETQTSDFAQLGDLSGDGNLELIVHMGGYPGQVYALAETPFENIIEDLGMPQTNSVADAVIADLDGDLDNDIFLVRGERTHGFVQTDETTLEVHIQGDHGVERGISFRSRSSLTIDVRPTWAWDEDEIYIGANGMCPADLLFTVSCLDTSTWGIMEHTPGVGPGMYVGYDPNTETWQILRAENITNLTINSTTTISEISAIGWDPLEPLLHDRLLVNLNDGFEDQAVGAGILEPSSGRGVVAGDFDNDMDLDLYILCTGPVENWPNILYENHGDGTFSKVPAAGGAAGNNLGRGDGVSTVDFDNNGFLDISVTNGISKPPFEFDGPTFLFKNQGNENHWIEIELEGVVSNRDGVGAQLHATAGGITQLREQNAGSHCRAQNHQRIHFGLGPNTMVDVLEIRWPNGITQEIYDIPADQIIQITEATLSPVPEFDETPTVVHLNSCYPNPFNPSTTITFVLGQSQPVTLSIHDAAGRLVTKLIDGGIYPEGTSEFVWNGRSGNGSQVSSGVYFLRLQAGSITRMNKMVMLK